METYQYQRILQYLLNNSNSGLNDKNAKRVLRKTSKKYAIINDKLYLNVNYPKPMVIQEHELLDIMKEMHDNLALPTTTIFTFFLQKKMFRLKPNFLYLDTSTSSLEPDKIRFIIF